MCTLVWDVGGGEVVAEIATKSREREREESERERRMEN